MVVTWVQGHHTEVVTAFDSHVPPPRSCLIGTQSVLGVAWPRGCNLDDLVCWMVWGLSLIWMIWMPWMC